MNERRLAVAAAIGVLCASGATSADAARVFYADFEGLNGGVSASNYTDLPGLTFQSGSVDLVHDGDNGVQCPSTPESPGTACLDLEGADGTYGRLQSAVAYEVHAGDTVTLSFAMSGNQRLDDDETGDGFFAGFRWGPAVVDLDALYLSPSWMLGASLDPPPTTAAVINGGISNRGWANHSMSFVAPEDMLVSFRIGGGRASGTGGPVADDMGVLIGHIELDITRGAAAVPEPATWAMMLMGFGGLGAALRRRAALA